MKFEKASNGQLAKVFVIGKEMGIDHETLRARSKAITGVERLSQLSWQQCGQLIESLTGERYQPKAQGNSQRPINRVSQGQLNKIFTLCREMGWVTRDNRVDKKRLQGFVTKCFKIDYLDWMTPAIAIQVTEALKRIHKEGRQERDGYPKA